MVNLYFSSFKIIKKKTKQKKRIFFLIKNQKNGKFLKLEDYIEIDSLDFFTKYALVITNFIIIIVLLVYNSFKKARGIEFLV